MVLQVFQCITWHRTFLPLNYITAQTKYLEGSVTSILNFLHIFYIKHQQRTFSLLLVCYVQGCSKDYSRKRIEDWDEECDVQI